MKPLHDTCSCRECRLERDLSHAFDRIRILEQQVRSLQYTAPRGIEQVTRSNHTELLAPGSEQKGSK